MPIHVWCDSEIVLGWLTNPERSVFVANQVKKIRVLGDEMLMKFGHVRGDQNPADLGTRICTVEELEQLPIWWNGPGWLRDNSTVWPPSWTHEPVEDEKEEVCVLSCMEETNPLPPLINLHRFGTFYRLLHTTMLFLRAAKLFLLRIKTVDGRRRSPSSIFVQRIRETGHFNRMDYRTGELWLIQEAQTRGLNEKLREKFNLYEDEDKIYRSKTRLQFSSLPADSVAPIFLPKNDRLTTLIVLAAHARHFHSGVQLTHAVIWRDFVGISKRSVRQLLSSCIPCKLRNAAPYTGLPFPPLPAERVQPGLAFKQVGLDYLGPTEVEDAGQRRKLWILLICCLKSRAVWLDGVLDLTTESFIRALKRFISRRGSPSYIICDNATTFGLAHKTIDAIWRQAVVKEDVMTFAASEQIAWKHITPHAAWEGGVYERMVGIAKNAFKRAIGKRTLPLDQMQTVIAEVEAVMNSRPLIDLGDDAVQALRPFDFLQIHGRPSLPPLESNDNDEDWLPTPDSSAKLLSLFRKQEAVLNRFWRAWQADYISSLKSRQQTRHHQGKTTTTIPKEGELVIVVEDNLPRGQWKLGRIVEAEPCSDGVHVRAAKVKLPSGNVVSRSIMHLLPLEIGGTENKKPASLDFLPASVVYELNPEQPAASEVSTPKSTEPRAPRPKREAKTKALQKIADWTAACAITGKPKLRLPFFWLSLLCMFLPALASHQCPSGINSEPVFLESTCNSKGFAVYETTTAAGHSTLCYRLISCGQKRFKPKKCSTDQCFRCPSWASGCAQQNTITAGSNASNAAARLHAPDVDNPNEPVSQILLFDETKHFVHELNLETREIFANASECYGNDTSTIGSPHYCHLHECAQKSERFCYYPLIEVTYIHTADGSIPIKAWGSVTTTSTSPAARQLQDASEVKASCEGSHLHCTTRGVRLTTSKQPHLAEICCQPYCQATESPAEEVEIPFPKDLLLSAYQCTLQIWDKNHHHCSIIAGPECSPKTVCDLLDCVLCREFILNPQCWPTAVSIVLGCMLGILMVILHFICSLLQRALRCLSCLYRLIRWPTCALLRRVRRTRRRKSTNNYEALPAFVPFAPGRTIITLSMMALAAHGSTQFASFTATEESCARNKDGYHCSIDHTTVLNIQPSNQEATLLIKTPEGKPLGSLKISTDVSLECQKTSRFFSRSTSFRTHSAKRCPAQGSCHGDACSRTTLKSKVSELAMVNDLPGVTHCVDSCSWLECGCGLPTSSCLFFRTVAVASSPEVFEFFSCPAWKYTANIQMELAKQPPQPAQHFKARLQSGMIQHFNSVRISLGAVSSPPLPILAKKFGTNGKQAFIFDDVDPKFQCPSRESAAKMTNDCEVSADVCDCAVTDPTVSCNCVDGQLERHLKPSPTLLPIQSEEFLLRYKDGRLFSTVPHADLTLQVMVRGLTLSAAFDNVSCLVEEATLSGCYNCLVGATLNYRCSAQGGTALAHVSCSTEQMFDLQCGGGKAATRIQFQQSVIDTACEVTCPGGVSSFQLKGDLVYVAQMTITEYITTRSTKNEIDAGNFLAFFMKFKFSLLPVLFTVAILTFILALTLYVLLKTNPASLIVNALFRRAECRGQLAHDKIV
jgi:hypothetical protein